jgi:hypothetical protein
LAERARSDRDGRVVGPGAGLAAERAADVGGDDSHVLGVDADRLGQQVLGHVGVLGGHPGLEALVGRAHQDRVALDGRGRDPLVDHAHAGDVVGVVEHVRGVLGGALGRDVGADRLELQGRVGGQGVLDVDHRRQLVVVDVDQLGGVHRLGAGAGHDQRDRVAGVAHPVDRECRARRLLVDVGEARQRLATEVGGGEHGEHAVGGRGRGGVQPGDACVGEGAADEGRMGDTCAVEVVHEGASPEQELLVLDAADLCPKDGSRHATHTTATGRALR